MIEYRKGDLFEGDHTEHAILAHACNAKGRWGSGIAKEFAWRFPTEYQMYQGFCRTWGRKAVGHGFMAGRIGCLITSDGYGDEVDSPEMILNATEGAVDVLLSQLKPGTEVHSPKINSGLFKVPWEETEKVINSVLTLYPDIKWVVWEL